MVCDGHAAIAPAMVETGPTMNDKTEQRISNSSLRCRVYETFDKTDTVIGTTELAALLGYKDFFEMKHNFTQNDADICRALVGPYGWTIYQILLIKNGHR